MVTKFILLTVTIQLFATMAFAQNPACKALHTGSFKVYTKEVGTTYIKRTENQQTERNDDLGYEVIFDIVWINDCTYELRPKKLIKGDPSIMGDGTHVLRTVIKKVSDNSYTAESTASFSSGVFIVEVEVIK